jgi:F0F1-type ATP synthase assembly protein I
MNWRPVIIFYVKTTSWIIFPLFLGLIVSQFTENQTLFFIFLIIGFCITCLGIYKEIKQYRKEFFPEIDQYKAKEKLQDGNK